MKFEKITDVKIKIILTLQDMELNHVSAENILSNSVSSQKLLQEILYRAKKEIGFDTGDSKLLVEAIMSSNTECTFTITKLDKEKKILEEYNNFLIFKFEYFDDFISLCTFLKNFNYLLLKDISKNFTLIYYNGTYFLRFSETGNSSVSINYIKNFFAEFGKNVSYSTCINGLLNEYGKIIFAKDAIIKCIKSFENKNNSGLI